jgi:MFS family permease
MVGVMAMTPLHMTHHGLPLNLVGLAINIHILGMYGASPILGWLADRLGGSAVIGIGVIVFAAALMLGGFTETARATDLTHARDARARLVGRSDRPGRPCWPRRCRTGTESRCRAVRTHW